MTPPPPRDSKRPNPILAFSSFLKSYVSNDSGADSEKPTATSSSNSSTTAGNTELNRKLLSACNDPDTSIQDVKQLLKQGANANAMLDGLPPFLACCRTSLANIRNSAFYSSLEIARALVKSGADVNCANYNGVNAFGLMLNYNIVYGDEEADQTQVLIMNKPIKRPPDWVFNKLAEYTDFLAESGLDFNKTCEGSFLITPLEAAAQISPTITEIILNAGADPNCTGAGGHTPLVDCANVTCPAIQPIVPPALRSTECALLGAKLLIDHGADVNLTSDTYWTPLQIACIDGFLGMAKLLIENDADVNKVGTPTSVIDSASSFSAPMLSPLHLALLEDTTPYSDKAKRWVERRRQAKSEIAELLIKNGADVQAFAPDGFTPLHRAAQNGYSDICTLLIDHGAQVNDATKDTRLRTFAGYNCTALFFASSNNDCKTAKTLLGNGADQNIMTNDESFPLYVASQLGHCEMAKLLLENGADPNKRDSNGFSPLFTAIENHGENSRIARLLKSYGATDNGMLAAKEQGFEYHRPVASVVVYSDKVEIEYQCPKETQTIRNKPMTPQLAFILLIAIEKGASVEAISELLDTTYVSVNSAFEQFNLGGASALYAACMQNRIDLIRLLIERGADVDKPRIDGTTPLFCATSNGLAGIAKELIAAGADVNHQAHDGRTPLVSAASNNQIKLAKLLIANGAIVSERCIATAATEEMREALTQAYTYGHLYLDYDE